MPKVAHTLKDAKVGLTEQADGTNAVQFTDSVTNANRVTAFGELLTAGLDPQAAWRFDYGLNSDIVSNATENGATVTVPEGDNHATLTSGTNTASSATMQSLRSLRYLPGFGGLARFTALYSQGVANTSQIVGIGDSRDGFFFGYNGAEFGVLRLRSQVPYWTAQTQWNGAALTFDPAKGNVYQIKFQYLGYGFIRFYIEHPDPNVGYVLVHTIEYPNTATETSIFNPTLPLYAAVTKTNNATNLVLRTASAVACLEGLSSTPTNPLDINRSVDNTATFANTSVNHLLIIRNKATFNSVTNRLRVNVRELAIGRGSAGAATSTFRLFKNATFGATLAWDNINATNSPVEFSTTTTTITSTDRIRNYPLSAGSLITDLEGYAVLAPSETLSIGVINSGVQSTEVTGSLNWIEEF